MNDISPETAQKCGFPGFFLSKKSVVLCLVLAGFDLAWPGFSWLIMGQQALFDPVMIKKWGNCEPKSGCFRGHFPLHFFDSMTAFVNGFSFEGDVLICQDLTKPDPVYLVLLSCRCYVSSGWTRTFGPRTHNRGFPGPFCHLSPTGAGFSPGK